MLLALDVGNTNTKLGIYRLDGGDLVAHWRLTTRVQTADEYGALFMRLFEMKGLNPARVKHVIISSVVPPIDFTLRQLCENCFHVEPMFVEPGMDSGLTLKIDHQHELGADRLAYSVGAYARYGGPVIVVEFGTATKFEVISERGEYLGGAIAPGLNLSAEALFSRAAKLSRVDIKRPAKVIGTNTVGHLQTGIYYGYIGLVDGILERIIAELGVTPRIVASGIMAHMIAADSRYIKEIDDNLTLDGLRILWERNRNRRPSAH
jgi:type III pantothenate kinase